TELQKDRGYENHRGPAADSSHQGIANPKNDNPRRPKTPRSQTFLHGQDPFLPFSGLFCCDAQRSFAGEARRNRDNISAVDKPPPEQPPSRSPEEQAILVIAGLWRAIPFI